MNDTSEATPEVRVLIVADYGVVREGLLALFRAAGNVEAAVAGAEESVWVTQHFAPDVILIDLGLSDGPALQTARSILNRCPAARLLFLNDAVRPARLDLVLATGAHGYWTKRASFDQLAAAIRRVAAGELSFCPAAAKYLVSARHGSRFHGPADAPAANLTRRESEILTLLAEGHSVRGCAERLRLSPSTINNHKSRMMRKLGVHSVVDLVRLAVREGLVHGPREDRHTGDR